MIRVDIPEKKTWAEFPDGTPQDEIVRSIRRDIYGVPEAMQEAQQYPLNEIDKAQRMQPPAFYVPQQESARFKIEPTTGQAIPAEVASELMSSNPVPAGQGPPVEPQVKAPAAPIGAIEVTSPIEPPIAPPAFKSRPAPELLAAHRIGPADLPPAQPAVLGDLLPAHRSTPLQPAPELMSSHHAPQPLAPDLSVLNAENPAAQPPATGLPGTIAAPFRRQGSLAMKSFNEATASFMDRLDKMASKVSELTGLPKGGLFGMARDRYLANAEQWNERAGKYGLSDEIVGEIIGGAVPGVIEFALGPAYSAAHGYAEGGATGAAKEATERLFLGKLLHAVNALKVLPRTVLGGLVGGGAAAVEGGGPREIAKGAASLGVFSASAVGGQKVGLREAAENLRSAGEKPIRTAEAMPEGQPATAAGPGPASTSGGVIPWSRWKMIADAAHVVGEHQGPEPTAESVQGLIGRMPTSREMQYLKVEYDKGRRAAGQPEARQADQPAATGYGEQPGIGIEAYEPAQATARPQPAIAASQATQDIKAEHRYSAIIKRMSEAFNAPVRVGKFRRMGGLRLGIYKGREKVVRVGSANDIGTVIHENGHHIQEILGWPKKHRFPDEVRAMAYAGAKDVDREGFAEFVRNYVTDEDYTRQQAPNFVKEFEQALANRADFQDVLVEARQAYNEFQAASSVAKVSSFIVRGSDPGKRHFPTMSQIYTEIKDSLYPLKKVVDIARKQGGRIAFHDDPYIVARLLRGWARKAQQFVNYRPFRYDSSAPDGVRFTGKGLTEILSPIERAGKMKELDTYLFAKRALHDERIQKGFDRILSVEDFRQTVQELEPEFKDTAEALYKYNDELLGYLVDSGRISKEAAESMRAKNLFYAPLYRLVEQETSGGAGLGHMAANVFNPVKRLKGSSRDIISPTENILRNTYAMINAAERNRLGAALMKLSRIEGMGKYIEKVPFPLKPINLQKDDFLRLLNQYGEFEQVTDIKTSEREFTNKINSFAKDTASSKMENVAREALKSRGWTDSEVDQIIARIKGAENSATLNDVVEKTIEKTTTMTIKEKLGFAEMPDEMIATFRPNYKAGPNEAIFYQEGKLQLYQLDPELNKAISSTGASEVNMLIKLMSYPARWLRAGATTFSPEFGIRNPMRDQMTAWLQSKYGFIPGYDFLRGAFHMLRADDVWQKFNASGAAHSAIVSMDRDYLSKNLRRMLNEKRFKGLIANPLELLQRFSEITEEASRVGEFARALKKEDGGAEGLAKAGFAGREVSIDFGRTGGAGAKAANMISAFWNARLEGLDKMVRTFKDAPFKTSAKAMLGITLPSIVLWWFQKDDPVYQELPSWRKTLFWNFVIHREGKDPLVLSLPKPFEYGLIFGSLPEAALDWAYREDPTLFKETAGSVAKTFDVLPIPTALIPMWEWWANKSWFFDRPIVPRGKEELKPALQYGPHTTETVKLIARSMDKLPALREVASPAKIENLIQGLTAGAGRTALQGSDWLLKLSGAVDVPPEPPAKVSDMPGIRAIFARFPAAQSQSIERFYDAYNDKKRDFESFKAQEHISGQGTGFERFYPVEEQVAQGLSMYRKLAQGAYESPDMTPEEKEKALRIYYVSMINLARLYFGLEPVKSE